MAQNKIKADDIELTKADDGLTRAQYKSNGKALDGNVYLMDRHQGEGDYTMASFSNGYATGKWEVYQANKLQSSLEYKDGYPDGEYIKMYFEYVVTKGRYEKGKKEGEWLETYSNGKKRRTTVYENDTLVLKKEYHLEGGVQSITDYKNNTVEEFAVDGHKKVTRMTFYGQTTSVIGTYSIITKKDIYYYPSGAVKSELFFSKNPYSTPSERASKQYMPYVPTKEIRYKENGEIESEIIPKMNNDTGTSLEDMRKIRYNIHRIERTQKGKSK